MGRNSAFTSTNRLVVGVVLAVGAALLFYSGEIKAGVFAAVGLGIPYLTLVAPFQCKERTRQGAACRNTGSGVLLGCRHHRAYRIRRILGVAMPVRPDPRTRSSRTPVVSSGPPGSWRETAMFWATVGGPVVSIVVWLWPTQAG